MNIGDTQPFPAPDRDALRSSNIRRGQLQRAAGRRGTNSNISKARKILAGIAENAARAACPVEQAKAFLRQRGFMVCAASVFGRDSGFVVGNSLKSEAEMVAMAGRRGFGGCAEHVAAEAIRQGRDVPGWVRG